MIAAGQDLDWVDAQGATLVRRGARLDWAGGSGPEPRLAGAERGQHWVEVKPTQWGPVRSLGLPPLFGDRVPPGMWRVSRAGISCFEKLGLGVGSYGLGRLGSAVHLFCLQASPLPHATGVHSEFIISTSSHGVSCFKTGATFIHSSRPSCFALFILLPGCTLSHLSALFHCLSLMLMQQPLFWFPDFRAQTPQGPIHLWFTHPLVHPSIFGSRIHPLVLPSIHWSTHPSISSPIHPLVHPSIHWSTHQFICPPIHSLVHPSIHWTTHPSIGLRIHPLVHPSIHWFTHLSIGPPIHPLLHPSIHWFTYPSIGLHSHPLVHPSIHLFTHPSVGLHIHPLVHPSIHWSTHPSIGQPISSLVHPSIHWFTHPSIGLYIHSLVHPSIHWFTHPSISSPIHPLVHPSIHWSTHPFIGSPIHPLVHPSIHWSAHPSIGSPIHHSVNIHILCATCFTRHWRQRMMESSLYLLH